MSGIFGLINYTGNNASIGNAIPKMAMWNRAYGRQNEECYCESNMAMGCCHEYFSKHPCLKTPVIRQGHVYCVVDALLYNREELVSKCQVQNDLSDEELLVCYINTFGFNALKEVNGDFCGAMYNTQTQTLTLFRDHMGVRPLYYYDNKEFVAYSTDIRGLLALEAVDTSISEDWIFRTLSGYYMDTLTGTEYQHIFCVTPASFITFFLSDLKKPAQITTYWHLGQKKIRLSSFDKYKEQLKELTYDSITQRLNAVSGLVGAELSGGLDSGVIDILIHRNNRDCVYYSWSVDPDEVPYATDDERLVIADICAQENITCHFSHMQSDYGLNSNIARNMQNLGFNLIEDEPPALRYALPPYINALTLCETGGCMAENGVNIVFTGHGGDEGISHRCNAYELFYHHEYFHFLQQEWLRTQGKKRRIVKTLKACYKTLAKDRKQFLSPFLGPFGAPELLNADFANKFRKEDMPLLHFAFSPVEYIQEGGSRNRLDNVALIGAYNGVRYLVPYLDYRVIDFAVSIPRYLYLNGSQNRYIFRETFKDIMPASLYAIKYKDDNSRKNYASNPNWFDEFSQRKKDIQKKLNRDYWEKYLNFDVINTWLKQGKPSEEERRHETNILMCLFYCSMAQNLVEKARSVSVNSDRVGGSD